MKKSFLSTIRNNFQTNVRRSTFPVIFSLLSLSYAWQIKPIGVLLVDLSGVLFATGLVLAIRELKKESYNSTAILSLIVCAAYIIFFVLYYQAHLLPGISF